jgi:hypothetical protein
MGREIKTITVSASVSRHNSDQDRYDDDFVYELRKGIEALVAELRAEYPDTSFGYVDVSGP